MVPRGLEHQVKFPEAKAAKAKRQKMRKQAAFADTLKKGSKVVIFVPRAAAASSLLGPPRRCS